MAAVLVVVLALLLLLTAALGARPAAAGDRMVIVDVEPRTGIHVLMRWLPHRDTDWKTRSATRVPGNGCPWFMQREGLCQPPLPERRLVEFTRWRGGSAEADGYVVTVQDD